MVDLPGSPGKASSVRHSGNSELLLARDGPPVAAHPERVAGQALLVPSQLAVAEQANLPVDEQAAQPQHRRRDHSRGVLPDGCAVQLQVQEHSLQKPDCLKT